MRRSARAAVALGLVLFAGCASDGDGPTSDTTTSEATSTTAAGTSSTAAVPSSTEPAPATEAATTTTLAPRPITADDVATSELATFESPIDAAARSSEPDVLFVAERAGRIRRVALDGSGDEVVLDISDDTTTDGERGLLGITFSPDGGLLYVSYTDDDGNSIIDEYGVADDGTVDTESRRTVIQQEQPFANHNGGHIAFGPDGYLYFGLGDGGAADDPQRNGLDVGTLLGKLVRIDPSTPSDGLGYTIPDDNPFIGVEGARAEIWAVGLRNPWRFSFDRTTGDLWIGDVGQNEWEEVDVARAADGGGRGLNFGWSAFEGNHRFNDDQPEADAVPPLLEYEHGDEGCSITGGVVYRGSAIPALAGTYVFGDYCSGRIWGVQVDASGAVQRVQLGEVTNVVSFAEDAAGELYAVSLEGQVVRFTAP